MTFLLSLWGIMCACILLDNVYVFLVFGSLEQAYTGVILAFGITCILSKCAVVFGSEQLLVFAIGKRESLSLFFCLFVYILYCENSSNILCVKKKKKKNEHKHCSKMSTL